MKKDLYYLNHLFGYYYPFIRSGGTLLYLYLAMHQKEGQKQVEHSMTELELGLKMSHTSIRKYEIILVMMGLVQIETEYYHMYSNEGYQIKKKYYTVYRPLDPRNFQEAIESYELPGLERAKKLFPASDTAKYEQFRGFYQELQKIVEEKSLRQVHTVAYKKKISFSIFKKEIGQQDLFTLERLFKVYDFLPQKTILFYLYIWQFWIQSDYILGGIHIPRKQIKKELGFGDEQIREAMYQLCSIGLLDLQKEKYYRYFLIEPLGCIEHIELRSFFSMKFLWPKVPAMQTKYYEIYQNLKEIVKRIEKTM